MTADESACDGFRAPLPPGFCKRLVRVAPGAELRLGPRDLPDVLIVVEEGVLELECRAGARRCFGRGSMIPIGRLPVAYLRNAGRGVLVLLAVSRAPRPATDQFSGGAGSYCDS